jgi:hypothetical protein
MRAILLTLALLVGLAIPARADDMAAARAVISTQTDAIGRGDAAAAYAQAAPGIQRLFPDPSIFMSMVEGHYAPLVRPRRFEFGEGGMAEGRMVQRVHIVDSDGVSWEALYTLERQPDGSVRITGCSLLKADQAV